MECGGKKNYLQLAQRTKRGEEIKIMKRRDKITGDILIVLTRLTEGHYKENRGKGNIQNDRG